MTDEVSMLDINFDEVYDFELLPDGEEVELRIARAEVVGKKANEEEKMLHVVLEDPGNPKVDDIHLYMPIPSAEMRSSEPKRANKMLRRIQQFYETFDIDTSQPVVLSDIIGNTGYCIVGVEEAQGEFGERNYIRSFVKRA